MAASPDRFVAAIGERLKRIVVDDALKAGTHIGPVVDESQLKQDTDYIEIGQREGAKLFFDGELLKRDTPGFYLQPALFTEGKGLAIEPQSYFTTERRRAALAAMKAHVVAGTAAKASESEKHGTVGAVALDSHGDLAAATSTGGYNNKPDGRVGDSPIIGAGTYARNGVCAVSGTGKGEYFIRHVAAHEVASRVDYLGESLEAATRKVIVEDLKEVGAGLVAVDANGAIAAPYNTDGMFRGWVNDDGEFFVASHAEVYRYPEDLQ